MASERELNLLIKARDQASKILDKYGKSLKDLEKNIDSIAKGARQMDGVTKATEEMGRSSRYLKDYTSDTYQMYKMQKAASDSMRQEYRKLAEDTEKYGGSTRGLLKDVDALGKKHKKIMDDMINNNSRMRESFYENIGTMQAASKYSDEAAKQIKRSAGAARILDRAFLGLGSRLEDMAKKGNVARVALEELGPTASMKELDSTMKHIRRQGAAIAMLQFGAAFVVAGEIIGLVKLSNIVDGRLIPAFENFKKTWLDALTPFLKIVTDVMLAVLNFGTAVGKLMDEFSEAHPMLSNMLLGFLALIPPLFLILAPLALGLSLWKNYRVMFTLMFAAIKPLVVAFLSVIGTVMLVSAAIVSGIAAWNQMIDNSGKLRESLAKMGEAFGRLKDAIMDLVGPVIESAKNAFIAFLQTLTGVKTVEDFWTNMGNALAVVFDLITVGINALTAAFQGDFSQLQSIFQALGAKAQTVFTSLLAYLTANLPGILQAGIQFITNLITGILQALPGIVTAATQARTSFVTALVAALPGIIQTGGKLITSLIQGIVTLLPMLIQSGVQVLNTLINGIISMLPMLVTTALQIIQTLLTSLIPLIPLVLNAGIQIIMALVNGIAQNLPMILNAAIKIITMLLNTIVTNLPKILNAGISMINQLIQGLTQMIPSLIPVILSAILTIINTLIQNLPKLIDAGVKIITALVQGLLKVLPKVIDAALKLITGLVNGLVKGLPKLIDSGVKLITALVQGLVKVLPKVIDAAIKLVTALLTNIIKNVPKILDAGVKLITALVKGLIQVLPQVISGALKIIAALLKALIAAAPQILAAGVSLIKALVSGIGQMKGAAADAARSVGDSIKNFFSGLDLSGMGRDIMQGLINGIKGMAGAVASAASNVVSSAMSAAKKFLKIKSPSRKMMEVGGFFSEGFANGITDAAKLAKNASTRMTQKAIQPVEAQRFPVPKLDTSTGYGRGAQRQSAGATIQVTIQNVTLPAVKNGQDFVDQVGGFSLQQAFKAQGV